MVVATRQIPKADTRCGHRYHRDPWECVLVDGHEGVCKLVPSDAVPITADEVRLSPALTDEALQARCDALSTALRDVLRLCVDRKAHAFPEQQSALWRAEALLVEVE